MILQTTQSFNERYYRENNYSSYLERHERYERMVQELHYDLFRKLKLDFTQGNVLDFGCAVGFIVKAFVKLGYKNVMGYDVSEWAVNWGNENLGLASLTTNFLRVENDQWNLMTAFDVFEHMCITEIERVLEVLKPTYLLVRIPLSQVTGGRYVLDVSENDPTHLVRFTRDDWKKLFEKCRFQWLFDVNVGLFYDTEGVMCSMFRYDKT